MTQVAKGQQLEKQNRGGRVAGVEVPNSSGNESGISDI